MDDFIFESDRLLDNTLKCDIRLSEFAAMTSHRVTTPICLGTFVYKGASINYPGSLRFFRTLIFGII